MKRINVLVLIGVVFGGLFTGGGAVFAQWPGQEKPAQRGSGDWPGAGTDRNTGLERGKARSPARANNLLCAFDYLRAARAMSHFRRGRSGRPVCPAGGSNFGSYFSGDRRKALEDLIKQAGVRRDRIVAIEKRGFRNAAAVLCEGRNGEIKRLIIWDPKFLGELDRKAKTPWASVAVLAHEIAHHLNLDTGQQRRPTSTESRKQELYADWYSGAKLRQLGASRRQAVAVFYHMGAGGSSHPPWKQRVAAAGRGWDGSSGARTGGGGDRDPGNTRPDRSGRDTSRLPSPGRRDPYRTPQPQRRMATICMTPRGFCRSDPRRPQVPVGAPCSCVTPFGQFYGIGR